MQQLSETLMRNRCEDIIQWDTLVIKMIEPSNFIDIVEKCESSCSPKYLFLVNVFNINESLPNLNNGIIIQKRVKWGQWLHMKERFGKVRWKQNLEACTEWVKGDLYEKSCINSNRRHVSIIFLRLGGRPRKKIQKKK